MPIPMLRHRSIGTKLVVVIMSTTAVALLVACAGLLVYDQYSARRSSTERLTTIGDVVAAQSAAAVRSPLVIPVQPSSLTRA